MPAPQEVARSEEQDFLSPPEHPRPHQRFRRQRPRHPQHRLHGNWRRQPDLSIFKIEDVHIGRGTDYDPDSDSDDSEDDDYRDGYNRGANNNNDSNSNDDDFGDLPDPTQLNIFAAQQIAFNRLQEYLANRNHHNHRNYQGGNYQGGYCDSAGNNHSSAINKSHKMATLAQQPEEIPQQTCFVDGNFADLAQEMANYVQVGDEVSALIQKDQEGEVKNKDEVLKKIVLAIPALLSAPEKEFTPAYNCLSYLVLQSDNPEMFLPRVCDNLMKPITSSPVNGTGLALTALSNIFNMLPVKNELRYNVFMAILQFLKHHSMFDNLKGFLPCLPQWFIDWDVDEEDQRKLYIQVAEVAREAGDEKSSYEHVLKALLTFAGDEVKSEEAQQLALRALKVALSDPAHNDFFDILAVPAVQALADSHPVYYELLMIFAEKDLEDYNDFKEEHEGFIEKEHLDGAALEKKMRLLTFASLAAQTFNREIPYEAITKALQIPMEQVELWTIDVVRAGLVEGRLSQQTKVFKVHRTDYRVFGEKQWREIGDRLESWKVTIRNIQDILTKGKIEIEEKTKREAEELERRMAQAGLGGSGGHSGLGGSGGRRGGGDRAPRRERNDDDD